MRDYELVVLLHPDLEINLDKPLKKVADAVSKSGGKVVKQDIWGKRKLAYPIKKENFAVYVYYDIQLPTDGIVKTEGLLNITDEVLRYLITKPVPVFEDEESEKEGKEKEDKKAEKPKTAKTEKPKEEKKPTKESPKKDKE